MNRRAPPLDGMRGRVISVFVRSNPMRAVSFEARASRSAVR